MSGMTTDTKKLAKFAAEFLGKDKLRIALSGPAIKLKGGIDPKRFFDNEQSAPILADLAKRKMEKRGFDWDDGYRSGSSDKKFYSYSFDKWDETCPECGGCKINIQVEERDENEYIALWGAIEATGEK